MTIFIPKKAIPEIRLAHLYPQDFGVRRAKKAISPIESTYKKCLREE